MKRSGKYEFSDSFLEMSEKDFKAEMKWRFKVSASEAKKIFNSLHGNGSGIVEQDTAPEKEGGNGKDSVPTDKEVS